MYGNLADFGLDDVTFSDCDLPAPTDRDCHDFEFRCDRDVCVDKDRLCDYTGMTYWVSQKRLLHKSDDKMPKNMKMT